MHIKRIHSRQFSHRACCALCSGQTTAKSSSTRQRGAFSQGAAELETSWQLGSYLVPATDTCQTRMRLSLYPAKRVWPSALQASDKHWGGSALAVPGTSGLSSSTMFALKVPDLYGGASGGTQPVPVGAEGEGIDGISMIQGVEVLAIITH